MRTTNTQLLKELIKANGEQGLAKAAIGANVGVGTLQKLMCGSYGRTPRGAFRARLSEYFKVSEEKLFPLVGASGEKAS